MSGASCTHGSLSRHDGTRNTGRRSPTPNSRSFAGISASDAALTTRGSAALTREQVHTCEPDCLPTKPASLSQPGSNDAGDGGGEPPRRVRGSTLASSHPRGNGVFTSSAWVPPKRIIAAFLPRERLCLAERDGLRRTVRVSDLRGRCGFTE